MVGIRVGVGKVGINAIPMCTSQDIVSIVGINERLWSKEYISLALQYEAPRLAARAQGATITGITSGMLKEVTVPARKITGQAKIVAELNSVKESIRLVEKNTVNLQTLVKSRFIEMFGDPISNSKQLPVMRIDEIADVQTGATPLRSNAAYYSGPIPWVKTGEVASGLTSKTEETITELAIRETNCKLFPAGTILVAMYGQGDTRGKAAILQQAAATNQACAAILPNDGYDAEFILTQLNLRYKDLRLQSLGGNQKNLSLKIIKSYKLPVPDIKQQREFAAFARQAAKLEFVARQRFCWFSSVQYPIRTARSVEVSRHRP